MYPASLKLATLSLNDSNVDETANHQVLTPSDTDICDNVALLWRQEPEPEELQLDKLYIKLKSKNPLWSISKDYLKQVLKNHNLYVSDKPTHFTYHERIISSYTPGASEKLPSKIQITHSEKGKALCTKVKIAKGELILHEEEPLTFIAPLEKYTLMQLSKACGTCGTSLNQSCHYYIMHNLDCDNCTIVWCSKKCKTIDTTHSYLKHPMSKNKICNSQNWLKFEQFCKENTWYSAYAVGMIYARQNLSDQGAIIDEQFNSLAKISQRIRLEAAESTNIGGTLDSGVDIITTISSSAMWEEGFYLLCEAFPHLQDDNNFDLEAFLCDIGRFNLNQINGQIYPLFSHINHSCEPNTYFEFDKHGIKAFARKDIAAGEELLTTYVNPLHDVNSRRRELCVNWGFLCNCRRCKKELLKVSGKRTQEQETTSGTPSYMKHRRKSSMKVSKPSVQELLENGKEFDLEVPSQTGIHSRRPSVRFDNKVIAAVEE
ncbi:S-adenosylmethionine-dependent methyltransferase Ecym_7475 [Eremothecium cymbalariae DBVPG|uniref:Histone-lysine N-methyltransferase SET5 n=1 Tax=Eremothecium cymbalariae (strain CBS 270.75 / DBVPG 7215 / KCTC 17166 / NRRL Y-17582) TaxID=931890 RepID=G8JWS7_ERECY|nr:hypothetical protein Ecym_7475 [Eremothecium cymbalariae DBVPG\